MHRHALAPDFDTWSEVISGSFVPLESEPSGRPVPRGFRGSVDLYDLGDLALSTVSASPHTVHRTDRLIRDGGNSLFKLSLQLAGRGLLIQDGREVVLEPGRMALYDTSRPYTLTFDRAFSCYVLMFPHSGVDAAADQVAQLTATDLGTVHGMGGMMGAYLDHARRVLPEVGDDVGARLVHHAVDLVGTVVAETLGLQAAPAPTPCRAAGPAEPRRQERELLRADVVRYVQEHLSDPGLDPASIAREHFMSVRGLHQLFAPTETTVAALIREGRLERCRSDLADPSLAHRPVAVIGARWGLTDPAHFSRIFRDRFGDTPARFRRRVLGD